MLLKKERMLGKQENKNSTVVVVLKHFIINTMPFQLSYHGLRSTQLIFFIILVSMLLIVFHFLFL